MSVTTTTCNDSKQLFDTQLFFLTVCIRVCLQVKGRGDSNDSAFKG